jgi:hypothetical protein
LYFDPSAGIKKSPQLIIPEGNTSYFFFLLFIPDSSDFHPNPHKQNQYLDKKIP